MEPLYDLQEAQWKTSNMAPKPTFRRGNLEKSSALRWSDAPNLGATKIFLGGLLYLYFDNQEFLRLHDTSFFVGQIT